MIDLKNISNINIETPEGKLLMASIAILTSIEEKHIKSGEWGPSLNPDDALQQISTLANKIYYQKEWEQEQIIKKRDQNINRILNNE